LVYYQYMRRALVHLDPKGVIPERVKLAFDIMTEGVVVLDSRGRVLLANRAFCQLIERDDAEITGEPLALLAALATSLPADPGTHPWNRSMQTAQPVMGEAIDLVLSAHRSAKLVINCAPITDARGAVRGCVATFADFSALHMANERLSDALTELAASRDEIARKNVELEQLATHDVLTGCLTRRAFFECPRPISPPAGKRPT
jgi:PAS domain-containing protein